MTMSRGTTPSKVLAVRIDRELESSLDREARRRRTTRSELVRELLSAGLGATGGASELEQEAARQSALVSGCSSEEEVLDFLERAADTRGWV